MPVASDPGNTVAWFEAGGGSWEVAIADGERGAVDMDIRSAGVSEVEMIEKNGARTNQDAGRVDIVGVKLKPRVGDARLW